MDKTSEVNVLLKPDGPKKKSFVCHVSRLKRCFGKPLPKFTQERRVRKKNRGRPSKNVDEQAPTSSKNCDNFPNSRQKSKIYSSNHFDPTREEAKKSKPA